MATVARRQRSDMVVLHGVTYKDYVRFVQIPANYHLRMVYHDGVLEIVSPKMIKHEVPSERLRVLIAIVAEASGLDYQGVGSGIFRKKGDGPFKGVGKEPDRSFYFANAPRLPKDRDPDLDAGDPPPDLWIEVDNRVSSAGRLPIYAALGVPEVWCYRVGDRKMQFLRLVAGRYEGVDRSLSLPILTPSLVRDALALGDGLLESAWVPQIREWARRLVEAQAAGMP